MRKNIILVFIVFIVLACPFFSVPVYANPTSITSEQIRTANFYANQYLQRLHKQISNDYSVISEYPGLPLSIYHQNASLWILAGQDGDSYGDVAIITVTSTYEDLRYTFYIADPRGGSLKVGTIRATMCHNNQTIKLVVEDLTAGATIDIYIGSKVVVNGVKNPGFTITVGADYYWECRSFRYAVRHGVWMGYKWDRTVWETDKEFNEWRLLSDYSFKTLINDYDIYSPLWFYSQNCSDSYMFFLDAYHDIDVHDNLPKGYYFYPYRSKVGINREVYITLSRSDPLLRCLQAIHILNKYGDPDYSYPDPSNLSTYITPRLIARETEGKWNGYGIPKPLGDPTYATGVRTGVYLALESILGYKFGDSQSQSKADETAEVLRQVQWPSDGYGETADYGVIYRPWHSGGFMVGWKTGSSYAYASSPKSIFEQIADFLGMRKEFDGAIPTNQETTLVCARALQIYMQQKFGERQFSGTLVETGLMMKNTRESIINRTVYLEAKDYNVKIRLRNMGDEYSRTLKLYLNNTLIKTWDVTSDGTFFAGIQSLVAGWYKLGVTLTTYDYRTPDNWWELSIAYNATYPFESTTSSSINRPTQRKSFFANGRHWVFYSDGTNMVYATSTDGIIWTSATVIRPCTEGSEFSIWFDGVYLYYAYLHYTGESGSDVMFRRGVPNMNGIITWSAPEQDTGFLAGYGIMGNIISDLWTGQNPPVRETFICFRCARPQGPTGQFVIKNSREDGTWVTDWSYMLTDVIEGVPTLVPLGGPLPLGYYHGIYAIFVKYYGGCILEGKRWNGNSWSTGNDYIEGTGLVSGSSYSAVGSNETNPSSNNYIYVVFEGWKHYINPPITQNELRYVKYTYFPSYGTGGWSNEITIQAPVDSASYPVVSVNLEARQIYCIWAGSPTANHIYYKKCNEIEGPDPGEWDASPTDWITAEGSLTANDRITGFHQSYGNKIGLAYSVGTAPPCRVYYRYLTIPFFKDGFESGDFSAWTGTESNSAITVVNTTAAVHHGKYGCQVSGLTTSGNYGWAKKSITATAGPLFERAYFKFTSDLPQPGKVEFIKFNIPGGYYIYASVRRRQWELGGTYCWSVCVWNGATVTYYTSPDFTFQSNTWYCLEFKAVISSTVGEVRLWVNGVETITATNINTGTTNINEIKTGAEYSTGTSPIGNIYFDCVVVADSYIGTE